MDSNELPANDDTFKFVYCEVYIILKNASAEYIKVESAGSMLLV